MSRLQLRTPVFFLLLSALLMPGCTTPLEPESPEVEEEAIARTEFTGRIENFFEYTPLVAGQPSEFLIHLTDLSDGSPVSGGEVDLTVRSGSGAEVLSVRALVGRVTGIYVAEVAIPQAGVYEIQFDVRAGEINETMRLAGFEVQ